jgi:hypothetical protein
MPTGYTCDIEKGITFNEFIMKCARAFGACIEMRDAPSNTKIPKEFKPSNYHKQELKDTLKKLAKIEKMSVNEATKMAKKECQERVKEHKEIIRDKIILKNKYNKMLNDVNDWTPPSKDHIGLKDFMQQQIKESIKFDCDITYYEKNSPILMTGEQWKKMRIEILTDDIKYHTRLYTEEVQKTQERNCWIKQLRESLQ